jgi:hypothetical protein
MPKHVLETVTGDGEVYAGDVLLRRTRYDLTFWSDAPRDGQIDSGNVQVDGHIDLAGMGEALVLAGADQLTLHLQDGRRLPFALTGTGGAIVVRGRPTS